MKLDLKLNPASLLRALQAGRAYLVGLALIGVFGYTAYAVNDAFNVKPAVVETKAVGVGFDQATLNSLKSLNAVNGEVGLPALGKADPFGN